MITFEELIKKAKEKGYKPLLPEFGDEKFGRSFKSQRVKEVELAAISAWVIVKFKIPRDSEVYRNYTDLPFDKRVRECAILVSKLKNP